MLHAPRSAIQFFARGDAIAQLGYVLEIHVTGSDLNLQSVNLLRGQTLDPLGNAHVLDLLDLGLLPLRGSLLRGLDRLFRLFVAHRTGHFLLPSAVQELPESGHGLDLQALDAVRRAVVVHVDEEGEADLPPLLRGLGIAALLEEFLDDRVIDELRSNDLLLRELDQAIVDTEGLGFPVELGESGRTGSGLGVGVLGGIHGLPLSLA